MSRRGARPLLPAARRTLAAGVAGAVAALGAVLAAGCGGEEDPGGLAVVTTVAPVDEAVRRVGGERVRSTNLTPVGGRPHDLALTPGGVAALGRARLVLWVGEGFQPAIARVAARPSSSAPRVDVLRGTAPVPAASAIAGAPAGDAPGTDPHLWVSPRGMAAIVARTRDALAQADPDGRGAFDRNARPYLAQLAALDRRYRERLASCGDAVLLSTHPAFGALAREYGLRVRVAPGISPSATPAPGTLRAVRRFAARAGVRTLFLPGPVPSRLAATLRADAGLRAATLSPIEGFTGTEIAAGRGVLQALEDNLRSLVDGLDCGPPAKTGAPAAPGPPTPGATTPGIATPEA